MPTVTEALDMIERILKTCELNLDSLEPDTVETIEAAETLLVRAGRLIDPTVSCQHSDNEDCMICNVCGDCREDLNDNGICGDCRQ
jgi:hypothetical protein